MKRIFLILILLFFVSVFGFDLEECYKLYSVDSDTLFLNAIAVLNAAPGYTISEIQSKSGYILFFDGSKYYLLTVTRRYKNQSEIKILPQNSDYSAGSTVAADVFNLISLKLKKPLEQVK